MNLYIYTHIQCTYKYIYNSIFDKPMLQNLSKTLIYKYIQHLPQYTHHISHTSHLLHLTLTTVVLIKEILKQDQEIKKLAEELYQYKSVIVMGRGFNYATCLEGALVSNISIHLLSVIQSIHTFFHPSFYPFIHPSIHPSIHSSIH